MKTKTNLGSLIVRSQTNSHNDVIINTIEISDNRSLFCLTFKMLL